MKIASALLVSLAVLGAACSPSPSASSAPGGSGARGDWRKPIPLAMSALPAKAGAKLAVTSPAFKDGQPIPQANTAYGDDKFPGLAWSGAPADAKSIAVIVQDSDPPRAERLTIVHWLIFNAPATTTKLDPGITALPDGAFSAASRRGQSDFYTGPKPPPGAAHHYHFQVFALDEKLPLGDGARTREVMDAMKDHVLASGEVVGTFQAPAGTPAKP